MTNHLNSSAVCRGRSAIVQQPSVTTACAIHHYQSMVDPDVGCCSNQFNESVVTKIQDELSLNVLMTDAKLTENDKVLKAFEDGLFPVPQQEECNTHNHRPNLLTDKEPTFEIEPRSTLRGHSTGQHQHKLKSSNSSTMRKHQMVASEHSVTMNDTAIALALQEELYQQDHQTNRHEHSSSNVGFDDAVTASDHQLACLLQEEFDDEMAHNIHQQQQHHHQTPTPTAAQYTNDTPSNNLGVTSGQPVYIPPPVPPNQPFNESTASNEELSYEVLSELEDVAQGLTNAEISRYTRLHVYATGSSSNTEDTSCVICCDMFVDGQQLRCLPCFHSFHRYCIDKWLYNKRTCPICLKNVN